MSAATVPRLLTVLAVSTMVVAGIGFIATLILNAFVLDRYNAYGEVPIPGRGQLHLPAGEVTISFHTQVTGSNGGLPIPELRMAIDPPAGVPEPVVTENIGGTTTVNNDARVRVWVAQVAEAADYTIRTDGQVGGFISPRLAFGPPSPMGAVAHTPNPYDPAPPAPYGSTSYDPASYTPTEDGIRLQTLKTLAALRDSGALTEAEFQAEKRRVLGGG